MEELPRVLLIGDSIRQGYEPQVRRLLSDVAEVHGPAQNGGDTRHVLGQLATWLEAMPPDVVLVNAGLHDVRRARGSGEIAVPLDEYARNVGEILQRLRARTDAVVLWSTMTPVDDARHAVRKSFDRHEADVVAYNAAAVRVCRDLGVPVHDLHAVIWSRGPDMLWQDGIHLSDEGYRIAAESVAGFIRVAGALRRSA